MWYRYLYPWAWYAWAAAFAALEGIPLATGHTSWTLSDYVWRLEELGTPWTFLRYLIAVLSLWLFLHLTFGLFR
jgi:hypothetical protein